ncbi:hypothetical protein FDUTEX481_00078 [Tolypothrix sp. PCC 7601]|nr:hypothetical protein FDUTEX481_00078 [Tolypothrix sp. PCC 7601]
MQNIVIRNWATLDSGSQLFKKAFRRFKRFNFYLKLKMNEIFSSNVA